MTTGSAFLSADWISQVRSIKERHGDSAIDQLGLLVNATITGTPFGDDAVELHSAHGPVIGWVSGHDIEAVLSFTVDYAVARELVLDRTLETLEQAITSGQLRIDGDRSELRRWWSTRINNPDAVALDDEVRAATV